MGVSGSFYFIVQTDVNGQVFQDGATANNVAATATAETVNLTPPPALTVSSITAAGDRSGRPRVYLLVHGHQRRRRRHPQLHLERCALPVAHAPPSSPSTAISLGQQDHQGILAPSHRPATATPTPSPRRCPTAWPGRTTWSSITDSGNAVFELSRANNRPSATSATQVSTAPADLVVSSASTAAAVVPGSPVLVDLDRRQPGRRRHGRHFLAGQRLHRNRRQPERQRRLARVVYTLRPREQRRLVHPVATGDDPDQPPGQLQPLRGRQLLGQCVRKATRATTPPLQCRSWSPCTCRAAAEGAVEGAAAEAAASKRRFPISSPRPSRDQPRPSPVATSRSPGRFRTTVPAQRTPTTGTTTSGCPRTRRSAAVERTCTSARCSTPTRSPTAAVTRRPAPSRCRPA